MTWSVTMVTIPQDRRSQPCGSLLPSLVWTSLCPSIKDMFNCMKGIIAQLALI